MKQIDGAADGNVGSIPHTYINSHPKGFWSRSFQKSEALSDTKTTASKHRVQYWLSFSMQYDQLLAWYCRLSVCPSVGEEVYCG